MDADFFDGDWWIRSSASHYFSKELLKYFVQLYISYRLEDKIYRHPCTGILVDIKGKLLWISAGHVVESIVEHYENGSINDLRWIDRREIRGAESLPFQKRKIDSCSGISKEADYGAILLTILEAENFRMNESTAKTIGQ
jgi:hypothetical protein